MSSTDLIMGSAGSSTAALPDPNFKNVSLLLSGDGTNGAQNNTFLDSSTNNFTITRNGNTTQGSFSPYGNLWSNYFDGSGDYLSVPNNSALDLSADFTIDCWYYGSTLSGEQCIFHNYNADQRGVSFHINGIYPRILAGNGSWFVVLDSSIGISANTWNYIAATRSGSTWTILVNGVSGGTASSASTPSFTTDPATIGRFTSGTPLALTGYVSNLRVVKGTALTITVPTSPSTAISGTSLLTCQSNRFIDNSSNNFAITPFGNTSVQRFSPFNPTAPYDTATIGGSGYFDGSGDYLSTPNVNLSTLDFCLECWAYATNTSSQVLFGKGTSDASEDFRVMPFYNSNTIYIDWAAGSDYYEFSNAGLKPYCWNHIAIVRISGVIYAYVNGIRLAGSQSLATITNNHTTWNIGGTSFSANSGYVSDARITTGNSVYSGASYSVPTSPLAPVSGTALLLNMTNAGIPDLAMQNNLETVGNAQVSTSVKKYGTGSLAFDGTDDYLTYPFTPQSILGTSNWTIEGWFYLTSLPVGGSNIISINADGITYASARITVNLDGSLYFLCASGASVWINTTTTSTGLVTTNTWYHVAGVRNGSTFTLYLNGTSRLSYTSSSSLYNPSNPSYIGALKYIGGFNTFVQGYIDDLRVTNGLARYTANFTPPTSALPTY